MKRSLVCRIHLLASCLALLALLVAACAPAALPTPAPTPTLPPKPTPTMPAGAAAPTATPIPKEAMEKPQYGGVLIFPSPASPAHFDMHQQTTLNSLSVLSSAYSNIVERTPNDWDKVVPALAESWEMSNDGLLYTFHLRKDVKFHDGTPFTSADAVASLSRIISPPKDVISAWQGIFPAAKKIEAQDDYTLKLTLTQPQASLLPMLSYDSIQIYPKRILDQKGDMKRDIMGTGPFKLKNFQQGVVTDLERNPDYYRKGLPYLDGVKILVIKDQGSQIAAYRTGQLNFGWPGIQDLPPKQRELLRKQTNLDIKESVVPSWLYAAGNIRREPWNDLRVRKAVHLALDRQAAIRIPGQGVMKLGWWMHPNTRWAISEAELLQLPGYRQPKDQDRAEAKKLLTEAGFPNGFKTTLETRSQPEFEDLSLFIRDQLANIGITIDVKLIEEGAFKNLQVKGEFNFTAYASAAAMTEPDGWFGLQFVTGAAQNYMGFSSAEVDRLYKEQSATTDPDKRRDIVMQMQKVLEQELPLSILYWNVRPWILAPEVQGLRVPPADHKVGVRFDYIWLAKK